MTDSQLNGVHVESCRRDDFRRTRQALLEGRGLHTLVLEQGGGPAGGKVQTHEQPPATADYWLIYEEGIYPLKAGVNTIGRVADNDVVIEGPYVSRRHCVILVDARDGCELYDVASKNGTYVNGRRVNGSTHLVSSDEIRICHRRLVFL
jgi:pSer/pThr/pTyr-binding forkhead associated (FHA) protein